MTKFGVIALGARWQALGSNRRRRGQVIVEMAISFVGFVMLTYVILKVWTWLTTNIMQRQAAFQSSRLAAGQEDIGDIPGRPVNFRPVPLQIIGVPGATPPGGAGTPYPPDPGGCLNDPRVLAAQFQADGEAHMAQYNTLQAQVNTLNQLLDLWQQIQDVQAQIVQTEADILQTQNDLAQVQADIAALEPQAAQLEADIDNANDQIDTLQDEIDAFLLGPPPGNPADPYVTSRQTQIADLQSDVNDWQNQLDAIEDQIDALEDEEAALQAQLANLQQLLLDLQAQLAALQAQYDALKAGAGFAVDDSVMPDSMIAQRDAIWAQALIELDLANAAFAEARRLMSIGIPICQ